MDKRALRILPWIHHSWKLLKLPKEWDHTAAAQHLLETTNGGLGREVVLRETREEAINERSPTGKSRHEMNNRRKKIPYLSENLFLRDV